MQEPGIHPFNRDPEGYDRYRPSFPSELIAEILAFSHLPQDQTILEIGAGTGKATELFLKEGYPVVALEPGEALARYLRKKFEKYPHFTLYEEKFESWTPGEVTFPLIIAAQSLHFVSAEVRYKRIAELLQFDGTIAVFGHIEDGLDPDLQSELDEVYDRHFPSEGRASYSDLRRESMRVRTEELLHEKNFKDVTIKSYRWSCPYKTDEYLGLLDTYSNHQSLSVSQRKHLYEGIAHVFENRAGRVEMPYLTALTVARVKK